MSEESKITSVVKTKDPRRVEAGKRLGMISKQAKERKAREAHEAKKNVENEWFPNTSIGSPVVGIGFVGLVGLALYFAYSKKYKTVKSEEQSRAASVGTVKSKEVGVVSEVKPKRVYKELDTLD